MNIAAVNYHFGTKDALLGAVLERHIAPVNKQRLELFDRAEAEAGSDGADLEDLVRGPAGTGVSSLCRRERWRTPVPAVGRAAALGAARAGTHDFSDAVRRGRPTLRASISQGAPAPGPGRGELAPAVRDWCHGPHHDVESHVSKSWAVVSPTIPDRCSMRSCSSRWRESRRRRHGHRSRRERRRERWHDASDGPAGSVGSTSRARVPEAGTATVPVTAEAEPPGQPEATEPAPAPPVVEKSAATQPADQSRIAEYEVEGVDATLEEVRRTSDETLTVRWRLQSQSTDDKVVATGSASWYDPYLLSGSAYLIDAVNKKKYLVITDSERRPLASRYRAQFGELTLPAGQEAPAWAMFPAPPSDVTQISIYLPGVPPFENVPITP